MEISTSKTAADCPRMLLVDDDTQLLRATKRFLGNHFSVDTASSATEGMHKLEKNDYDAVVTDFDMPKYNGVWLLTKIKKHFPKIKRILHSGSNPTEVEEHLKNDVVQHFLSKPSTLKDFKSIWEN